MIEQVQYLWSKTNRWHRGLLLFFLVEFRVFPGGQTGFTCNDPALSHPYTGDTVNWKWLLATTIILPLAVMLIVERKYNKSDKSKGQALCWYREYLYGVLVNLLIVQTLKLIVGSPRPHFFDTCDPKEAATCQGSEYVPNYTCTKAHWLSQSDRSFPSGHTSLAVHTGIFLAYYLYRRTSSPRAKSIVSLQLACVAAAVLCSVSRMTDHRHHWWDVLAGAAIATPVLLYTINSLCDNFECSQSEEKLLTEDPTECDQSNNHATIVNAKET